MNVSGNARCARKLCLGQTLHSDSQAELKTVCFLVHEGADALDVLASLKEVNLVWIPEHRRLPGNEKVDELANRSRQP